MKRTKYVYILNVNWFGRKIYKGIFLSAKTAKVEGGQLFSYRYRGCWFADKNVKPRWRWVLLRNNEVIATVTKRPVGVIYS